MKKIEINGKEGKQMMLLNMKFKVDVPVLCQANM